MAVLTIRSVDESLKTALRVLAAQHGVSMEEEARRILREALHPAVTPSPLGQRLLNRFADSASTDFALPARQATRPLPAWVGDAAMTEGAGAAGNDPA